MLIRFSKWCKRHAKEYLDMLAIQAPVRPIVLIQSDDWGRAGCFDPGFLSMQISNSEETPW